MVQDKQISREEELRLLIRSARILWYITFPTDRHERTSVHQMDLELQLVLWKQLHEPFQKILKKIQIYSPHHSYFLRPVHLICSFSKYHLFAVKDSTILSTHFLMLLQTASSECVQRFSGFPGSPGHLFGNSSHAIHVSTMETTRIWKATFNRAIDGNNQNLESHF